MPKNRIMSLTTQKKQLGKKVTSKPTNQKRAKKKYVCTGFEGCNMVFTRSENLTRHRRKHTGEKPFKCHVCLKFFSRIDNLKQHIESVHGKDMVIQTRRRRNGNNGRHETFTNITLVHGVSKPSTITATSTNAIDLNSMPSSHLGYMQLPPSNEYRQINVNNPIYSPNLMKMDQAYGGFYEIQNGNNELPTPPPSQIAQHITYTQNSVPHSNFSPQASFSLSPINQSQYVGYDNIKTRRLPLPIHANPIGNIGYGGEPASVHRPLDNQILYNYNQPELPPSNQVYVQQERPMSTYQPPQQQRPAQTRLPQPYTQNSSIQTYLPLNREYHHDITSNSEHSPTYRTYQNLPTMLPLGNHKSLII
ncbi:hypothetical protein TPHA_0H01850 [Tetrapisispora phaffii CBS 4417]|uniref:C2H2-type domain-containing protein n=1 Tax=Tetrapisispora phaffii (strain ATCC 24235 / CBS 4417 / NBRC 1672 / NRRL Y-8282 / UCD 70-5) TaxID=1071381 RepID=G8BX86_TETPH|nr:hypothetical protein TPHA_0H01850 [Tetrapisispora phaffii CBS 4417]CCE64390.1 hypothetical protein TPHA_0H01850 [Tetrapisispora phaffii CBS 4417]